MKSELARRRLAASANVAAIAGTLAYATERGYAHFRSSGGPPAIILREARIGYLLALAIALLVSFITALVTAELVSSDARAEKTEQALERLALPVLLVAAALMFVWP